MTAAASPRASFNIGRDIPPQRRRIGRIDIGLEAIDRQACEDMRDRCAQRLVRQSFPPVVPVENEADLAQAPAASLPDHAALVLKNEVVGICGSERYHAFQPPPGLANVVVRQAVPVPHRPWIGENPVKVLQIIHPRAPEQEPFRGNHGFSIRELRIEATRNTASPLRVRWLGLVRGSKRNGPADQAEPKRNAPGPHFVSEGGRRSSGACVYWPIAQSETKCPVFAASLGKRRAERSRIRIAPGGTRTISGLRGEAHPVLCGLGRQAKIKPLARPCPVSFPSPRNSSA